MKFDLNWLKEYLDIKISPAKLAEILSLHSFEAFIEADRRGLTQKKISLNQRRNQRKSAILDVDILPNRFSDAANYLGLAREIAMLFGCRLQIPDYSKKIKTQNKKLPKLKDLLEVRIKDPNLCLRYSSKMIRGVKVAPSPQWLKERLEFHGINSINNVVDVTNYLMLELGQPLHAFDYDKIEYLKKSKIKNQKPKTQIKNKKEIIIRKAKNGEKIVTLDGEEKILDSSILVIADSREPLALAGIKGGRKAEITQETKDIVLESANFDPENIYLSSRKLGLRTDASERFEHGLDPNLTLVAIERLATLIQKLAGGQIVEGTVDSYPQPLRPKILKLDFDKFRRFVGLEIPEKEITNIIKRLGFEIINSPGIRQKYSRRIREVTVRVPTFRRDIQIPQDLYEEILRIYGLERIRATLPEGVLAPVSKNEDLVFGEKLKNILTSVGFQEVYNYSFVNQKDLQSFGLEAVELLNPVSQEFRYLRPSLLSGLLKNIASNFRYFDQVKIFECGKVFLANPSRIKSRESIASSIGEVKKVAGAIGAKKGGEGGELFFRAKGLVDSLFEQNGLDRDDYSFQEIKDQEFGFLHPGRRSLIVSSDKTILGYLGEVSKDILDIYKIGGRAAVFEIDLLKFLEKVVEEREFSPLPIYPSVIRDISFILDPRWRVVDVLNVIYRAGAKFVEDVDLFDVYIMERPERPRLPFKEKKSMAFHIVFQAEDHTLTDKEVDNEMKKIAKALKRELGAEMR